jgi:2-polyprenyl-6-methoxyphenol hydroxylase-like FAD-dependent oxidoreductase
VEADFVIGADGVHSVVREKIFTAADAMYTGRVAYRAVFPTDLVQGKKPAPSTKWWGDRPSHRDLLRGPGPRDLLHDLGSRG